MFKIRSNNVSNRMSGKSRGFQYPEGQHSHANKMGKDGFQYPEGQHSHANKMGKDGFQYPEGQLSHANKMYKDGFQYPEGQLFHANKMGKDGFQYREELFSRASKERKEDRHEDGEEYREELFSRASERRKDDRCEDGSFTSLKGKYDGSLRPSLYGNYDGSLRHVNKGRKDDRREDGGFTSLFQYPEGKLYVDIYPTSTSRKDKRHEDRFEYRDDLFPMARKRHRDNERPGEDGGFPDLPRTAQKCEAGKEVIYVRSEEETESCVDVMKRIESHIRHNEEATYQLELEMAKLVNLKWKWRNWGDEQRRRLWRR